MTENKTASFQGFGFREIEMASELLKAVANGEWKTPEDHDQFDQSEFSIEFNPNSGHVFIVDGEYNVAMLNDKELEIWVTCGDCGAEGFKSETAFNYYNNVCADCAKKGENN